MIKLSTLFDIEYTGQISHLKQSVRQCNEWVFTDKANTKPMRKLDGSACAIIDGILYARYDAKPGKLAPDNAIPCQDADPITGHHPHWVPVTESNQSHKWHIAALGGIKLSDIHNFYEDGTYELVGEKINSNRENLTGHHLVKHDSLLLEDFPDYDINTGYDVIKEYLTTHNIEGIVFHHTDGSMCKIRKSDYNIKRDTLTEQELEFLSFLEKSIKPLESSLYNRIEELRKLAVSKEAKFHDKLL